MRIPVAEFKVPSYTLCGKLAPDGTVFSVTTSDGLIVHHASDSCRRVAQWAFSARLSERAAKRR